MRQKWTPRTVHELASGFQRSCVVIAAAELDVFSVIGSEALCADEVARRLATDLRATTILLNALAALGFLEKTGNAYRVPPDVADILTPQGSQRAFFMVRHLGRCMRRWAQLSKVVRQGRPAEVIRTVLSPEEESEAFIEAMDEICGPMADELVGELGPPPFEHLLDVGGGSGTWTLAFLRAAPGSRATLFDLPEVIPLARRRLEAAGMGDRVRLVAGDYLRDALPQGADLAWLSAIVHQNSPQDNRLLLEKTRAALAPGGTVLIRDMVMESDRVLPPGGALFAINMLVSTPGGGTYTLEELARWLTEAGFRDPRLLRRDEWMNSIVAANAGE